MLLMDIARWITRGDQRARYRVSMVLRGVDLGIVDVDALGLDAARANRYSDSGGPHLAHVLERLADNPSERALDLGCGKGGALITLSRFFAQTDGVEISTELAAVARRNLKRLRIENAQVIVADAAAFTDLDGYNFIYLYNPFHEVVLRPVVSHIAESLERSPRRLRILYKYCDFDHLLSAAFGPSVDVADGYRLYQPTGRA